MLMYVMTLEDSEAHNEVLEKVVQFGVIPMVISSPNYTSLPSTVATFLTTCLMVVLQPSGYSIFHGRDTPIQLSLP